MHIWHRNWGILIPSNPHKQNPSYAYSCKPEDLPFFYGWSDCWLNGLGLPELLCNLVTDVAGRSNDMDSSSRLGWRKQCSSTAVGNPCRDKPLETPCLGVREHTGVATLCPAQPCVHCSPSSSCTALCPLLLCPCCVWQRMPLQSQTLGRSYTAVFQWAGCPEPHSLFSWVREERCTGRCQTVWDLRKGFESVPAFATAQSSWAREKEGSSKTPTRKSQNWKGDFFFLESMGCPICCYTACAAKCFGVFLVMTAL